MRSHLLCTGVLLIGGISAPWLISPAIAQEGSTTSQSPNQSSPAGQAPSQPPSASDSASQPQSLADAARANARTNKPKAKKVYTEDNLADVHGTISVVGDKSGKQDDSSNSEMRAGSQDNSESYWRSRAQAIKREIAMTDQKIVEVKAEIAKSGAASFDPSTGLSQGVIIIHDRNAQLKNLEDRKASLQHQLDDLADDARKAGADPGWTR